MDVEVTPRSVKLAHLDRMAREQIDQGMLLIQCLSWGLRHSNQPQVTVPMLSGVEAMEQRLVSEETWRDGPLAD